MRCTRCDRPTVPQAIGRTPGGTLVFGWCLKCLEEEDCHDIEVAEPVRGRRVSVPAGPRKCESGPPEDIRSARSRVGAILAALLGAWSVVLLVAGVWAAARPRPAAASPLGNGMPAFFLAGGAASAIVAATLWTLLTGLPRLRSPKVLRPIGQLAFVASVAILLVGIVRHVPKRDPAIVLAAALALAISVLARRLERPSRRS